MEDIESAPLLSNKQIRRNYKKKCGYFVGIATLLVLVIVCINRLTVTNGRENLPDSPVDYEGHLVIGTKGAVAVEAEECSIIGVEILKKGGNAVDAAIASTLCIGVIHSFATGIGGGGFMLIRSPNGTFEHIDFRETAPNASTEDMFINDPMLAQIGGLSVAIPGEIRGLELAHKRHGHLSWFELFQPSIHIARNGFKATELLEVRVKNEEAWMRHSAAWSEVYFPNGIAVKAGDIIKRPNLAKTLEVIAIDGADSFYEGDIGKTLVDTIQSAGGIVTLQDIKNYRPVIRRTMSTYYKGRKVTTCSAPTGGPIILSLLNLVERFELGVQGLTGLNVHRLVEAFKFGYAFRTEMGDPDFLHNEERMDEISTKDFASEIRQKITDNTTHGPMYYNPKFDHIETHGTMHLSVVDENDGAVALTSTVNLAFGSHIMDRKTGIVLNNEMDDFSIPGTPNMFGLYPSKYNYAGPGKRPLSSITPIIIEKDTKFEIAIGGSGGSMIPTATLNSIINILDYGKDLYRAIAFPRVHHQLMPNIALTEYHYPEHLERELEARNHTVFQMPQAFCISAVQGVRRMSDGTLEAASDPRKMGLAAAY